MVSGQCRLGAITNSITWPPPRSSLSPPFTTCCLNSLQQQQQQQQQRTKLHIFLCTPDPPPKLVEHNYEGLCSSFCVPTPRD
jgi:hypothetical protein